VYQIELSFEYIGVPDESKAAQGIHGLLGAWSQNGQILSTDWPIVFGESCCRAVVPCSETTSLSPRHANQWVRKSLAELRSHGLLKPKVKLLGPGLESAIPDSCKRPKWYFLTTHFLSIESPLRCGEHNCPVPLYRIPPTHEAGHYGILCWQWNWKACDQLQMACGFGERWATKQISNPNSLLSINGRELCSQIERLSGVPTYYYLYRGVGRSETAERQRPCPLCGRKWALPETLHGIIDFKCERCRLVSNIAWDIKR
jgi:predicted  nucleic acid-binding Zn ribbon protein